MHILLKFLESGLWDFSFIVHFIGTTSSLPINFFSYNIKGKPFVNAAGKFTIMKYFVNTWHSINVIFLSKQLLSSAFMEAWDWDFTCMFQSQPIESNRTSIVLGGGSCGSGGLLLSVLGLMTKSWQWCWFFYVIADSWQFLASLTWES